MPTMLDVYTINVCVAGLGPDEIAVVRRCADRVVARLRLGRAQYGELNLSTDRRDWAAERRPEITDAQIYDVIDEMMAERQGQPARNGEV